LQKGEPLWRYNFKTAEGKEEKREEKKRKGEGEGRDEKGLYGRYVT
jgi:hypothetical protein